MISRMMELRLTLGKRCAALRMCLHRAGGRGGWAAAC